MRAERFRRLRDVLTRRQPDLTVVTDRVNKAHNFSAILRNCDAVGVMDVHVAPPLEAFDLHNQSSAGTKKWIRVTRYADIADAVTHVRAAGFAVVAAHLSESARDYRDIDYTAPTALLVGAEKFGVSPEGLELADAHVIVPMKGMVHSLNVSVASSILLYEAMRQREAAGMYDRSRLTPEALDRRLFEWTFPVLAAQRQREGRPYPGLDPDGNLVRD